MLPLPAGGSTPLTQREIEDLTIRFTEAFNRDDLDAVMSFFAEDAFYDEFNGTRSQGQAAIRAAFVPQFRGDYGIICFHTEDLFVDPVAGKSLIRWRCSVETGGIARSWRGLDILCWRNGLLQEKHTYAKAPVPLLREDPTAEESPGRRP